ncbi:MAG: NADAR family protein [Alphaproteobacteria bacterium]|nr:MAG: NADAR family protein [Alphaproteobacteria bacterium]
MSRSEVDSRSYTRSDVVAFRKTNEDFGGLSNMAPGYPLMIDRVRIRTSEALYQACRFPHMPDVQRMIVEETSPMTAKMRSKPYREKSRPDWDNVRVPIMRWCLRVKLVQNHAKFSALLLATGNRPIVEDSRKDEYWGARINDTGELFGKNVLGRLLMEIRQQLREQPEIFEEVHPLRLENFTLYGRQIPVVSKEISGARPRENLIEKAKQLKDEAPLFARL